MLLVTFTGFQTADVTIVVDKVCGWHAFYNLEGGMSGTVILTDRGESIKVSESPDEVTRAITDAASARDKDREDDKKDAERYRKIRRRSWDSSELCVVLHPKKQLKLGSVCPSMDHLDRVIDEL